MGAWLQDRLLRSDLVRFYFDELRDSVGIEAGAQVVHDLACEFVLGHCHHLASAIGRRIGRDHVVSFFDAEDTLLHSVVSVVPQSQPVSGTYVDILGRGSLLELEHELSQAIGTSVSVGFRDLADPIDDASLLGLTAGLPWLRDETGEPPEPPGQLVRHLSTWMTASASMRPPG